MFVVSHQAFPGDLKKILNIKTNLNSRIVMLLTCYSNVVCIF